MSETTNKGISDLEVLYNLEQLDTSQERMIKQLIKTLQKERDCWLDNAKSWEKENSKLAQRIAELERELEILKKENASLTAELAVLRNYSTAAKEMNTLMKENAELRARLKLPKKVIHMGNIAKEAQDAANAEAKAQYERYGKDLQ